MADPMGEAKLSPLRVEFDRRLKLEFHGSYISSDGGLLPYRELDHALGLTEAGGKVLSETRRGKNTRHLLVGLLRQSVFSRLAGYEDVNDAVRLQLHAPAYNLANFMRSLALPNEVKHWSLTTLREKLVKIGAKVVSHGHYVTIQLAKVAVPRELFRKILWECRLRGDRRMYLRGTNFSGVIATFCLFISVSPTAGDWVKAPDDKQVQLLSLDTPSLSGVKASFDVWLDNNISARRENVWYGHYKSRAPYAALARSRTTTNNLTYYRLKESFKRFARLKIKHRKNAEWLGKIEGINTPLGKGEMSLFRFNFRIGDKKTWRECVYFSGSSSGNERTYRALYCAPPKTPFSRDEAAQILQAIQVSK